MVDKATVGIDVGENQKKIKRNEERERDILQHQRRQLMSRIEMLYSLLFGGRLKSNILNFDYK